MKTIRIIFSLLLITAMSMPTLSAQTKKEKKELKKQAVEKLVTSGKYKCKQSSSCTRTVCYTNFTVLCGNKK